ncbi:MAG: type II secretion system protein [Akkermansiaceae bacterium]|nr:type II secretion system protein [Akkermansiaceae bacterium]NNM28420.1 type II secretion system protein [Akkermansiaceae bacterium]
MNTLNNQPPGTHRGFTLIEMTLVIAILLALVTASTYFANNVGDWRRGKLANEALNEVYAAQRSYLADNPRTRVADLTDAQVIPYLPMSDGAYPTVLDLDGNTLDYDITVSPPVLMSGGIPYDPSGADDDSLWDVGK